MVHFCDRWIYPRADEAQRREFVTNLVGDLARLIEDSRVDVQGTAEYRSAFIERLNQRAADYATFSFDDAEGCSFAMRCRLGEHVQASLGERDKRWIPDYIVGRETPACESALRATLVALVNFGEQ